MPFVRSQPLEDYFDERAPQRAVRRIADAGVDRLHGNVRRRTPVSVVQRSPLHPRKPGTLRDSIDRTPVRPVAAVTPGSWGGRVFTADPIAPHVEWNTRAHDIPGAFGFDLPFGIGGQFGGKFHPGTTGQHMFARGASATEVELGDIASEPLALLSREVVR